MPKLAPALLFGLAAVSAAAAQPTTPVDVAKLEANAARRFPQPVLVSDLVDIPVLDGRLGRLGQTEKAIRARDGALQIVIRHGGLFGFGGRRIALPIAGIAMLGRQVVVMDITPEQLDAWPAWAAADGTPLPSGDKVKVALTKN